MLMSLAVSGPAIWPSLGTGEKKQAATIQHYRHGVQGLPGAHRDNSKIQSGLECNLIN